MEGCNVSQGFQGLRKHNQKKGELNLYDKYRTTRRGSRALIEPINDEHV
jgi:hypothetical protein